LASEVSRRRTEEAGGELRELRRRLAEAESERDRVRAHIEERGTALFEHHRTGGGSAPSGGAGR
jgi:hypothetical protein